MTANPYICSVCGAEMAELDEFIDHITQEADDERTTTEQTQGRALPRAQGH